MKAILLRCDDWEGLYVDGNLVTEGHSINGPDPTALLKLSEKYGFKSDDLTVAWLKPDDEKEVGEYGSLPSTINELAGQY